MDQGFLQMNVAAFSLDPVFLQSKLAGFICPLVLMIYCGVTTVLAVKRDCLKIDCFIFTEIVLI